MPSCMAEACGVSTKDLHLCNVCAQKLVAELSSVSWLVNELVNAQTRQTRFVQPGHGSRSAVAPLVWDERASQMLRTLASVLASHAKSLAPSLNPATPQIYAWWLRANINLIRRSELAGGLHREIIDTIRRARLTVDRPMDQVAYGVCGANTMHGICNAYLYAPPGRATIRCSKCKAEYDVAARRQWMLEYTSKMIGTPGEIATYLGVAGVQISSDAIRALRRRNRITEAGHTSNGRPLYRFADVLAAIGERYQRKVSA